MEAVEVLGRAIVRLGLKGVFQVSRQSFGWLMINGNARTLGELSLVRALQIVKLAYLRNFYVVFKALFHIQSFFPLI